MAEPKAKFAAKVKLDEGSLKELGWPSASAIIAKVRSGAVTYAKAVQKLNYLAVVNKKRNPGTATKAKSIMVRLKREFGEKPAKKK